MRLEWSAAALADLDRFAGFLHEKFPSLASLVAASLIEKSTLLVEHPYLGQALQGRPEYRQIVVHALGAAYVLQYRVVNADRIVILRAFHGRERRGG